MLICAKCFKYAAHEAALKRIAKLYSQKAEAHVPNLPKTKFRFDLHKLRACVLQLLTENWNDDRVCHSIRSSCEVLFHNNKF